MPSRPSSGGSLPPNGIPRRRIRTTRIARLVASWIASNGSGAISGSAALLTTVPSPQTVAPTATPPRAAGGAGAPPPPARATPADPPEAGGCDGRARAPGHKSRAPLQQQPPPPQQPASV